MDIGNLVTNASNGISVVTGLCVAAMIAYTLLKNNQSDEAITAMIAWLLVSIGYVYRIGYWMTARALAEEGERYADWGPVYSWTHIGASIMVLLGSVLFLSLLADINKRQKTLLILSIITLGSVTGALSVL